MRIALLANERALRAKLAKCMEAPEGRVEEFSTATNALMALTLNHYDLIVMHWKVLPGLGSGNRKIDELAALIPGSELNRNMLYWEVGLRLFDAWRADGSPNQATPAVIIFPDLPPAGFGIGDQLTREAVQADIEARPPAEAVYGPAPENVMAAIKRHGFYAA